MTRILITGVAGMIGSHLLDSLLLKGCCVVGIDDLSYGSMENIEHNLSNPKFKFSRIDVQEESAIQTLTKETDIVVHLAAVKKISMADSSFPTLQVNVRGTENVLKAAKISNTKFVFASTSDVYGCSLDLPFREDADMLIGPSMIKRWSYAVSKLYCEQLVFAYHQEYGLPAVVLRYFGGFSDRSSLSWSGGHIPIFIDAVLNNEDITIHGDGTQTRSMAYVSDLVDGTVLAMFSDTAIGEIINLGNTEELSVLDTAYLIHDLAGVSGDPKIKHIPFEKIFGNYHDIMRRVPDLSKAEKLLGYSPKVSIRDAIVRTISARRRSRK